MVQEIENQIAHLSPKAKQLLIEKVKIALKHKKSSKTTKSQQIVAYIETKQALDIANFKESLKEKMPDYMVPSLIIPLDKMPVLPNGKIDRSVLKKYHGKNINSNFGEIIEPLKVSKIEEILIQIWEETLGFSPIKITDNFFEIGGDSILSIQIVTKAKKKGIIFNSNDIFKYQTIRELALQDESKKEEIDTTVSEQTDKQKEIQKELIIIWEETLGFSPIKITDNFFEIGGDSILSIQIMSKAKKKGIILKPNSIFEHQTILDLSEMILSSEKKNNKSWKYIVPIKNEGNKNPLFCIHAGGGHAFTYKNLSQSKMESPVYAVQTKGIYEEGKMHKSIEQMSRDYADEIIEVQPNGVVNVLVYCFSTCVGIEIASYLKTKNRKTNILVADTIADHRLLLDKSRLSVRVSYFIKRFFRNPYKALKVMIEARLFLYFRPILVKILGSDEEKNAVQVMFHLEKLLNQYKWNTKADIVSLILTKKIEENYNKAIIDSWEGIIAGGKEISIKETDGDHATLFEYPDVNNTVKAIENSIVD